MNIQSWQKLGVVIVIIVYCLFRLITDPANPENDFTFHHDSAYLATVAQNVVAGKGYVNDALWLVFLNPERLPMPFHNGNPLYPTLVAVLSSTTGMNIFASGYVISVLSSGLLGLSLFLLIQVYCKSWSTAALIALAGTLFPLTLMDSYCYLTDALYAALFFATWASLVRISSGRHAVLAGILFGATWLTRSQAILMIPSVLVFVLLKIASISGYKSALKRLLVFGCAAFLVISPWLIHQYRVWGDPFRSDSSYYLLEEIQAKKFGNSIDRYWHSTRVPAGVLSVIQENPVGFLLHVCRGSIGVIKRLISKWCFGSVIAGLLLSIWVLFFVRSLFRNKIHLLFRPETVALILYGFILVIFFSLRGHDLEIRYFNTLTVFFSVIIASGSIGAFKSIRKIETGRLKRYLVILLIGVLWLGIVPRNIYKVYQQVRIPDTRNVGYRHLAERIDKRFSKGKPVVVGDKPYFYTLATGAPSLSIPESDDRFLLNYMKKYGADYIFLTEEELRFWRPSWVSEGTLTKAVPQELELIARVETSYLFRRKEAS